MSRCSSITDMTLNETSSSMHSAICAIHGVLFKSQQDLNYYILRIHVIGIALWQTFLCFDCTARDIDLSFITGLIAGWYLEFSKTHSTSCTRLAMAFICAGTMCVVVLTDENIVISTRNSIGISESIWSRIHLYLYSTVMPFATGVFWNIATPIPYSNIILDTQRSIVTFLLITITFPLYWTTLDINMMLTFLGNLPHLAMITLLVLMPIFKFISIYIMLISLKKGQGFDMILSLVIVLCVSSWIVTDSVDELLLMSTSLVLILVIAHIINIKCSCCASLLGN